MKKPEINIPINSRTLVSRQDYYRGIGEKAAMFTFTKQRKDLKKLTSVSPKLSRLLSPDRNARSTKELKILKALSPRDISHLKDRVISPLKKWADLPSDLKDLKKSIITDKSLQNSSVLGKSIQKETIEDNFKLTSQSYEKFSIEKLVLGPPSSRQTSENLKKWLENMKHTYCGLDLYGENAILIHSYCSKELIRQVSVSCIEQGQILQEILQFFKGHSEFLQQKNGSLELAVEEIQKKMTSELLEKEKLLLDDLIEGQAKMEALHQTITKKTEKIEKLKKKLKKLENHLEELKINSNYSDEKRLGVSLKRRGTLRRANIDGYSPLIGFSGGYERTLEMFNKPFLVQTGTQTDRTDLVLETFREFSLFEIDASEKELVIQINDCDSEEYKIGSNEIEMKNSLKSEESVKSSEKIEEGKNTKKKFNRAKTRLPGKKETLTKQVETEKKVLEKQEELKHITKKIKIKSAELDFITKTLHYKRVKEMLMKNQYLQPNVDLTIETIFDLKPSRSKAFNILADSEYWGEEIEQSYRKHSFQKSMTKSFEKSVDINEIHTEKMKRLNTIKQPFLSADEFLDTEKMNNREDSIRKSIFTDAENFVEQDLNTVFIKKSTGPLEGLAEKIDVNRISRKNNEKVSQAMKIVEKICGKSIDWIRSKANMNRKLLNKLIFSLYTAFYSKHENTENFLDYVYYDFFKRYGLKYVSDKKFVEFMCSLIKSDEIRKFSIFLRFTGLGIKINKNDLSKKSLELYLEGLSFLINSKIGVTFNEDFSDRFMVPLSRANELIKDQLEKLDKQLMLKVISITEYKSLPDPKRFNLTGIVDGETVLENIIENFETLKFKYLEGVEFLLNTIKFNEPKDEILKNEISMVIRVVCPQELESFEVFFDDSETISLEQLCFFIVDKKMFSINSLNGVIKDEGKDVHEVESMIRENSEEMYKIVTEMENVEKMMRTLPQQVWEIKIQNLEKGVDLRKPYESIFAFKVFMLELLRVHSTFL